MNSKELSIIIPSIRTNNWHKILIDIALSAHDIDYEIIFVGPSNINEANHDSRYIYIEDFGSPTRAIQIGSMAANKKFMCWLSDDGNIYSNSLSCSLDYFIKNSNDKDIMCLRYTENNLPRSTEYWKAGHHDDLKLKYINPESLFAPVGLLRTELFKNIGGLDCRYKHCNMSCIDLSLRIQQIGGNVILSPVNIADYIWINGNQGDHSIIHDTELSHDIPMFKKKYQSEISDAYINYNNWIFTKAVWERFK